MFPALLNKHFLKFRGIVPAPQLLVLICFSFVLHDSSFCQSPLNKDPKKVLVLFENKGHHKAFTDRAIPWLRQLSNDDHFELTTLNSVDSINSEFFDQFNLVFQLDYVPYGWPAPAREALIHYLGQGKGSWIGLHHAGLLGKFDGYPMWEWFSGFMGNIQYKNYVAGFAGGTVVNEDNTHPVMKDIPDTFRIAKEEWYTWDKSPRPRVRVLASVDEKSYSPDSDIKMGDHPVIWTNADAKTKNLYIFMGHDPSLFDNLQYTHLLRNAIQWGLSQNQDH